MSAETASAYDAKQVGYWATKYGVPEDAAIKEFLPEIDNDPAKVFLDLAMGTMDQRLESFHEGAREAAKDMLAERLAMIRSKVAPADSL